MITLYRIAEITNDYSEINKYLKAGWKPYGNCFTSVEKGRSKILQPVLLELEIKKENTEIIEKYLNNESSHEIVKAFINKNENIEIYTSSDSKGFPVYSLEWKDEVKGIQENKTKSNKNNKKSKEATISVDEYILHTTKEELLDVFNQLAFDIQSHKGISNKDKIILRGIISTTSKNLEKILKSKNI